MPILRWPFGVIGVCGCWRPSSWTSPVKKFLYNVYTCFLFVMLYFVTWTQLIDIVYDVRTMEEFSDSVYLFLVMLVACHKMYSLLTNRGRIAILVDTLEKEPFLPRDAEEIKIRARFDKLAEFNTIGFTVLVKITVVFLSFTPFVVKDKPLPYRSWLPYDYSPLYIYVLTYIQQIIALLTGGLLHVAFDSLICGFLIHTCSQIEFLTYRLRTIHKTKGQSVKPNIQYHRHIYRFVRDLNNEFRMVIFVQFAVSMSFVCINLLQLTTMKGFSSKLFTIFSYSCCMLTQIFFYCWYGNELKLKSFEITDRVFEIDWTLLTNDAKKSLLVLMRHTIVPMEIKSMHIVSLNVESFTNLLKTSYSAFNVLKQGTD